MNKIKAKLFNYVKDITRIQFVKEVLILQIVAFILLILGMANNLDICLYVGLFTSFFSLIFFSIIRIKERITLFFFLVTFFTFLLGKVFFTFGLDGTLGLSYYTNKMIVNHTFFSLFISLFFTFIGFLLVTGITENTTKKPFQDLENSIAKKVTAFLLIICFFSMALVYIEKIIFVMQYGYLSLYTDFYSTLPSFFLRFSDILPFILFLYLATFPVKISTYICLGTYMFLGVLSLGFGQRNIILQNSLFSLTYIGIRMYIDKNFLKLNKKMLISFFIAVPICIVSMAGISHLRDGESAKNTNLVRDFFDTQGNTVNVLGTGIRFKAQLTQKNYSFYELNSFLKHNLITNLFIDFPEYDQNTAEMALKGGSYGQAISYFYNSKTFIEGRGLGSCYIAEVYQDFGYIGIILTNIFYGIMLGAIFKFRNKSIWFICIIFYVYKSILYAPRSTPFSFFTIISFTNLFIYIFIKAILHFYKRKLNINHKKKIKKILIISDFFAPENTIAAVRSTKLAKFLNKKEVEVSVLTDSPVLRAKDALFQKDLDFVSKIIRIKQVNILSSLKAWRSKRSNDNNTINNNSTLIIKEQKKLVKTSIEILYLFNSLLKNMCFYFKSIIFITQNRLYEYDYVFSTYGQFSPHLIAKHLKSVNSNIIWIADFRDPIVSQANFSFMKPYCKWYEDTIVNSCDLVSAVSLGVLETINVKRSKSFVLTNGYDLDDMMGITYHKSEKLVMSYTGTIYQNKSDLTPLFECLSELINEKKVDLANISIQYAGSMSQDFIKQASLYNLEGIVVDYGQVSKQESLNIQANSNLLLLAAWNNKGNTGIVTGKFYEYMMMEKTILACISGNLPQSVIKSMIEKGNLGFCYEEANREKDKIALKDFILKVYNAFFENRPEVVDISLPYISEYNYHNISKKLLQKFEDRIGDSYE